MSKIRIVPFVDPAASNSSSCESATSSIVSPWMKTFSRVEADWCLIPTCLCRFNAATARPNDAPAGASARGIDRPKEEGEDDDRPNRPIGDSGERLSSSFRCRANGNGTTDFSDRGCALIAGAFCVRSSAMDTNGESGQHGEPR